MKVTDLWLLRKPNDYWMASIAKPRQVKETDPETGHTTIEWVSSDESEITHSYFIWDMRIFYPVALDMIVDDIIHLSMAIGVCEVVAKKGPSAELSARAEFGD